MTKIYLAGKMTGLSKEEMNGWREQLNYLISLKAKSHLHDAVQVINPVNFYNTADEPMYQSDKEYIRWEFDRVKNSNIVIVGWNKEQDSLGTMAELTYAYANNIPVILYFYDRKDNDCYLPLHPFVNYIASKIYFKDQIEELANYVVKYYC